VTTLGAHTFDFVWSCLAEEALVRLGEAGFRHVQLMATPPHYDPWTKDAELTRRLRSILDRYGMSLLALDLASSDINLASPSADVVDFAVEAYARTIDRAAELEAKRICVGSGRRHALLAKANDRLMESFRHAFARIHARAEQRGIGIILENHPQGLLADAKTIAGFLDAEGYSSVPVIYDVANAFAIGEDPVAGLATLCARLGIVHLSDSRRGQWRHDPIGTGAIDFSAIGAFLGDRGFEGAVVLEILSDAPLQGLIDGVASLRAGGFTFQETAQL
jgi:sugar phosphate isomerase/epimerase